MSEVATNGDSDSDAESSEQLLLKKHRKERRDHQDQMQKLKKSAPKGDKKRRKDVMEQIAKLEAELQERQEKELNEMKNNASEIAIVSEEVNALSIANKTVDDSEKRDKKPGKAQRRREKKALKDKEREERIKEQEKDNLLGSRHLEKQKLKSLLGKRNLQIHEIPSDGDCLYNAISHQLLLRKIESSNGSLRAQTAEFMRSHVDDFLPFLCNQNTGDPFTQEEYEKYCDDIANTPAWGGHLEIRALSHVLKLPLEVIQAECPVIQIGEEYEGDVITLLYHKHAYGLGEHYNSVAEKTQSDDEDEFS